MGTDRTLRPMQGAYPRKIEGFKIIVFYIQKSKIYK